MASGVGTVAFYGDFVTVGPAGSPVAVATAPETESQTQSQAGAEGTAVAEAAAPAPDRVTATGSETTDAADTVTEAATDTAAETVTAAIAEDPAEREDTPRPQEAGPSGLTPGLMALRQPPPPSLGPAGFAPGAAPGTLSPVGESDGDSDGETAAATSPPAETEIALTTTDAEAAADDPATLCDGLAGEERFFAMSEGAAASMDAVIDFGRTALACEGISLTIVGFSTAGENQLARGIASLERANEVVEALRAEGTGADLENGFAGDGGTENEAREGVEVSVL
ncbi:MAG: hypothetical protein AAF698_02625 [Pseudomonadota bacterium]